MSDEKERLARIAAAEFFKTTLSGGAAVSQLWVDRHWWQFESGIVAVVRERESALVEALEQIAFKPLAGGHPEASIGECLHDATMIARKVRATHKPAVEK